MSDRGDTDYKPQLQGRKKQVHTSGTRPRRATRKDTNYEEKPIVITSEEDHSQSSSEGEEQRVVDRESVSIDGFGSFSDTLSILTIKSESCWSPQTLNRKTENIITNLSELQSQLSEARMAKQSETSMADVMKLRLEMNTRDKQERERRDAEDKKERKAREVEREEQRIKREEKREEEQRVRDDARRRERERWEYDMKRDRDEREEKLLIALRDTQPAVPQTVFIGSTKLPKMAEGEDVQTFIELFEAAMSDNKVPPEQWKGKIHAALDSQTKLRVRDIITDVTSMYDALKDALIGCGTLSFSHASESLMTADRGQTLAVPVRQAIQKWQRLLEKMTSEATTIKEACTYVAVAVARYNTNQELKTYLDMKGEFSKDSFCRTIDEWLANKPPGTKWAKKQDYTVTPYERPNSTRQVQRQGIARKPGSCYHYGKGGHFAYECRSRLAGDKPTVQPTNTPTPTVKKEQNQNTQTVRNMSEVTCFRCRQKGHISPECARRTNRVKRIKIPAEKIIPLKKNEVFGMIGSHHIPITCDTGTEVTVVPAECVLPHQLTGDTCELKSFNQLNQKGSGAR